MKDGIANGASYLIYFDVAVFSWTDETNLIVTVGEEAIVTVVAHQSSREVIPCKPTSPKVELTLFYDNGIEVNFFKFIFKY